MATYRTILTSRGKELIAAAAAIGTPVVLTNMAVGDGNGNPVVPNEGQTSLARERYRGALNTLVVDATDPTRFIAELIVPAATGGFTMREAGIYTAAGELFAVANTPNTYKPTESEGSFGDTIIRMVFAVSNASVVTLVVDPNIAVATQLWVKNNVNAASIIPGGLTNQILAKKSNADGDTVWRDATEGVTVIVFSREETQTLSAGQTVIDLALITAEGAAVYIEGTRLRADQFRKTGAAQITLSTARTAGAKVTIVQNEEVGMTDMLLRPNNLADVPDKSAARINLGLPNWLAVSRIGWAQLDNIPSYGVRWPTFAEVSNKPVAYPPLAHQHAWSDIVNPPDYATRWATWDEISNKPMLFPPAAHIHAEYIPFIGGGTVRNGLLAVSRPASGSVDNSRFFSMEEDGATGDARRLDIALLTGSGVLNREILFRAIQTAQFTFNVPVARFTGNISAVGNGSFDGMLNVSGNSGFGGQVTVGGSISSLSSITAGTFINVGGALNSTRPPSTAIDISRAFSILEDGISSVDARRFDLALLPGTAANAREILFRSIQTAQFTFQVATARFTGTISGGGDALITGRITTGGSAGITGTITCGSSITSNENGIFSNGASSGYSLVERTDFNIKWSNYASAGAFRIWNNVNQDVVTVTRAGAMNVTGSVTAGGGFDFGSSRKLKDIEGSNPYGLDAVRKVSTLVGKYKPEYNSDGRRRVFVDAEQLAGIIPEAVNNNGVKFRGEMVPSVILDQLIPPAYKAIAELADIIDGLREEIRALKGGR
ncbi:tail collar fiber protein [Xanthomonas phage Murka]|nr:tail collar fiber protein [Xanthomonas phage Murka]